jgi:hypothetical protein
VIGFVLLDLLAWAAWLWTRLAARHPHRGFRFITAWLIGAVLPVIAIIGVAAALIVHDEGAAAPVKDARCLVMGYSAAEGSALRAPRRESLSARLGEGCGSCVGHTMLAAKSGQTLSWIEDRACHLPKDAQIGDALFLGGANDDIFSASKSGSIAHALLLIALTVEPIQSGRWMARLQEATHVSRLHIDRQSDEIAAIGRCLREHGSRFWFTHDFLVWDLETGRSDDRAAMMQARRVAVEQAGGTFIDLSEEFKGNLGVSWFNDFIHPSAIGHRRIADLVCARLAVAH